MYKGIRKKFNLIDLAVGSVQYFRSKSNNLIGNEPQCQPKTTVPMAGTGHRDR